MGLSALALTIKSTPWSSHLLGHNHSSLVFSRITVGISTVSRGARVLGQIRTGRADNVPRLAVDSKRCDLHLRDTVTCSRTTETGSPVWIEIAACGPA